MNKKGMFDDFIPWIVAFIFVVIALAFLTFVKTVNLEQRGLSFEYHKGVIGTNTNLVAQMRAPVDENCQWFHQKGITPIEEETRNQLLELDRNSRFTNLDWANLFMRLKPRVSIARVSAFLSTNGSMKRPFSSM